MSDRDSAKILVLGDSGVGKSSLIHLICHSSTLNSAQWTIGCSIDVKLHNDCFLEFWDIGGSRGHKIARSFLYQNYHGIILVFDATNNKSRLNLNEWLLEVSQKANDKDLDTYANINVPTITIATKKDLLPYKTLLVLSENSTSYRDQHVVSFADAHQQQQKYPYRRQVASLYSMSDTSQSSFHSQSPSSNLSMDNVNENLIGNQVIYVNTQDVSSFSTGTRNCHDLGNFFKEVIDKRRRRNFR